MKINSETKYRSIASQNQLSYVINGNINNTTGVSNFGLSGDNVNLNLFSFRTGKIYDVNNKHVWSYNPSEEFTISGNITPNNLNYYINDQIVCLSSPKNNQYYKYFYIESQNCTTDLDINIYGYNYPNYSIVFPFNNIVGDNITGYIKNNSLNNNLSFQFLNATPSIGNYYSLNKIPTGFISGNNSGELIFNYSSTTDPNSFNTIPGTFNFLNGFITFNTNFATFSYNLNVPVNLIPYYSTDFITNFTGLINNLYNYNYDLRLKSPTDQTVFISLSNITGHTGDLYYSNFALTGLISRTGYGFVYGAGFINGVSSGDLFSANKDYYGNLLKKSFTQNNSFYAVATGKVEYNYSSILIGGSALLGAEPGTIFSASGFGQGQILNNIFIYGSRFVTGSNTGILTGYWNNIIQTGLGVINATGLGYFTGQSPIEYKEFFWNGIPSIEFHAKKNPNYKIYGITGSELFNFINSNSGVINNSTLYTQQSSGIVLKKTFSINQDSINSVSGLVYSSSDVNGLSHVFSSNPSTPWVTSPDVSTGYLGIEFLNFLPEDLGTITHYEVSLNKTFSNYKYIPYLMELHGQKIDESWVQMSQHSTAGGTLNFYNNSTNIFPVTTTGNFKKVELRILNSILLPHINSNLLQNANDGLSINKVTFYSKIYNFNKSYGNLIPDPYTGYSRDYVNNRYSGYLFSTNDFSNLYEINKGGVATLVDDLALGIAQYKAYEGDCITGFYIDFNGFPPQTLTIDASTDNVNYNKFYTKTQNINSIESGLLENGIDVIGTNGYRFFRFNFGVAEPLQLISTSPSICYSGWWANTGSGLVLNNWKSVDMTADGRTQVGVGTNYSGIISPYTGFLYRTTGYGDTWSRIRTITGLYPQTVQLFDVKMSKKNGQFILACRDGLNFNVGNFGWDHPLQKDYKLILSRNSGTSFSLTGLEGSWQSVAVSYDGRVMAAVGRDEYVDPLIAAQRSVDSGVTWVKIDDGLDSVDLVSIAMSSGGNVMYTAGYFAGIYRSINTGLNWTNVYSNSSNSWSSIATSYDGKCVAAVSKAFGSNAILGGFYSHNSGINWQSMNGITAGENLTNISMSSDGLYQLITSDTNSVYRSVDSGKNFNKLNIGSLKDKIFSKSAISSGGQYQLVAAVSNPSKDWLYSSCIYGKDVYSAAGVGNGQQIKIKTANFYTLNKNNFFNLSIPKMTGVGNTNVLLPNSISYGSLLNPTGGAYQPAISYDTTLLTGIINSNASYGSYSWNNISIVTTGKPDTVFSQYITGNIRANGLLIYDTNKLVEGDTLSLNGIDFTYITGITLSDTDVINYISAVEVADGQPLELSVKSAINNFILGLKDDGIWDDIKASCLMAGPRTITGAMQPLIGSAPLLSGNTFLQPSIYYSRNSGILGNGNSFINTMRAGNADLITDHHNMIYLLTPITGAAFETSIGQSGSQYGINDLKVSRVLNNYNVQVQNRSTPLINNITLQALPGILGVQRGSNQSFELWNNINRQSISATPGAPPPVTSNLHVMGIRSGNSIVSASSARIGFYSIGSYIYNPIILQNRLDQYFKDIQTIDSYPRFSNPYSFSTFNTLISNLNLGATGGYDETLQYTIGMTGFISNNSLNLYSYYLSGENGNNCTLLKNTIEPTAIQIPNVYFTNGKYLRTKASKWTGTFYNETSNNISYIHTGYYKVELSPQNVNDTIPGVVFENNFSGNWYTSITPISQGTLLNTGDSINLKYDSVNKIFSGNFIVKSGISYLGYSGLNININKKTYNNIKNTGNFAKYIVSGINNKFLFTGVLQG